MKKQLMLALAVGMFAVTVAAPAAAQDEGMADHPVVGAWDVLVPGDDTPGGITVFSNDGTLIDIDVPPGAGVWAPTGESTADVLIRSGDVVVRAAVEVAEDGQSFSGSFTIEAPPAIAEAAGMPAGEVGPVEVSGTRINVEPMGDPVAPMPDFTEQAPPEESAAPEE